VRLWRGKPRNLPWKSPSYSLAKALEYKTNLSN
jgi:hypothetical protein